MKFAKIIFLVAGVWGVLLLVPLYFIFDMIGAQDPPPITHPAFFYGFAGLGLVYGTLFGIGRLVLGDTAQGLAWCALAIFCGAVIARTLRTPAMTVTSGSGGRSARERPEALIEDPSRVVE